jgi:hypothetical protein
MTDKPMTYMTAVDQIERAVQLLRDGHLPMESEAMTELAALLEWLKSVWRPPSEVRHYPVRVELQTLAMNLVTAILDGQ